MEKQTFVDNIRSQQRRLKQYFNCQILKTGTNLCMLCPKQLDLALSAPHYVRRISFLQNSFLNNKTLLTF